MSEPVTGLLTGANTEGLSDLQFAFEAPLRVWQGLLAVFLIGALTFFIYRLSIRRLPPSRRLLCASLRAVTVALVLFLLLQPAFVGFRFDPDRHYVLLLFDDSSSMRVRKSDGSTRAESLLEAYRTNRERFEGGLKKKFRLASYAFGNGLQRLDDEENLTFSQKETRVEEAITAALRDFQGIDVAAVVVFSDGAQQPIPEATFDSGGVPVFTVQVGSRENWRDVAAGPLRIERTHGDRRPVAVTGSFEASGLAGRQVTAEIKKGNRVVSDQILEIATDQETHDVRLTFTPLGDDWETYQFQVRLNGPAANDDRIPENNTRPFIVDNRQRFLKVLYFAGRPNWENKFVQRALRQDDELRLTSVLRISAAETQFVYRGQRTTLVNPLFEGFNRADVDQPRYDEAVFVRLGGDQADAGKGFPETYEELFPYDLIILGDVEANFFAQNQLDILRDFARKRGGAVLFLGGPHSFSEGDYHNTLIESMLPVLLSRPLDDDRPFTGDFMATPSVAGLMSGVWTLSENPEENQSFWEELPELSGLNRFPMTRPAADVWATTRAAGAELDRSPLFIIQRYGSGHTSILATGSTWIWHLGTEQEDFRHQRFWRQLARYLAQNRPTPVMDRDPFTMVTEGTEQTIDLMVRDKAYNERTGMRTDLTLTEPDGNQRRLPVDEVLDQSGLYRATVTPRKPGLYRWRFTAEDAEETTLGNVESAFFVEPDVREFRSAAARPEYMRRLAENAGGSFYQLSNFANIPDEIPFRGGSQAEAVVLPIWHFPGFFVVLVALLSLEWYVRRKGGYA